jgi:hypothetical protein
VLPLLGAALGKAVVPALVAGLLAARAVGVYILLREGFAAGRKTAIAYAPFLAFGGVVALLLGAGDHHGARPLTIATEVQAFTAIGRD